MNCIGNEAKKGDVLPQCNTSPLHSKTFLLYDLTSPRDTTHEEMTTSGDTTTVLHRIIAQTLRRHLALDRVLVRLGHNYRLFRDIIK